MAKCDEVLSSHQEIGSSGIAGGEFGGQKFDFLKSNF